MNVSRMLIAAAMAAIVTAFAGPADAEATKLRLHLWASPKHLINAEILTEWCSQLTKATEQRVTCDPSYPPNASPPGMFDRVKDGIADVAWGLHSYTPGRFLLTEMAELPGVQASSEAMTQAYWRAHEKYLAAGDEHKGVKLLGLMLTTPGVFQTRDPVNSMADLKEKKMRVPGGVAARVADRLGLTGIAAPANKVYEMLQQGVIEGALMPPETSLSFKLMEVTRHMTLVPGGLYYTSFFLVMNENTFNKLSKQDQDALMRVSGENYAKISGKAFDRWDPIGIEAAKKQGVEVTTANPQLTAEIKERTRPVIDAWIAEADKKGIDAEAALEYFRAEVAKLSQK